MSRNFELTPEQVELGEFYLFLQRLAQWVRFEQQKAREQKEDKDNGVINTGQTREGKDSDE